MSKPTAKSSLTPSKKGGMAAKAAVSAGLGSSSFVASSGQTDDDEFTMEEVEEMTDILGTFEIEEGEMYELFKLFEYDGFQAKEFKLYLLNYLMKKLKSKKSVAEHIMLALAFVVTRGIKLKSGDSRVKKEGLAEIKRLTDLEIKFNTKGRQAKDVITIGRIASVFVLEIAKAHASGKARVIHPVPGFPHCFSFPAALSLLPVFDVTNEAVPFVAAMNLQRLGFAMVINSGQKRADGLDPESAAQQSVDQFNGVYQKSDLYTDDQRLHGSIDALSDEFIARKWPEESQAELLKSVKGIPKLERVVEGAKDQAASLVMSRKVE